MKATQFEELVQSLFAVRDDLDEAEGVLEWACHLTRSGAGLLLRREGPSPTPTELCIYPETARARIEGAIDVLRSWYGDLVGRPDTAGGVSLGQTLLLPDGSMYGDALVVFAPQRGPGEGLRFELILLRDTEDGPFRSYECWAATWLLEQYERAWVRRELNERRQRELEDSRRLSAMWGAALTAEVMAVESWQDFTRRVLPALRAEHPGDLDVFLWVNGVYWTAYRVRQAHDIKEGSGDAARPERGLPTDARDDLRTHYAAAQGARAGGELRLIASEVLDLLLDQKAPSQQTAEALARALVVIAPEDGKVQPPLAGVPGLLAETHPLQRLAAIAVEHKLRELLTKLEKSAVPVPSGLLGEAELLFRWILAKRAGPKGSAVPAAHRLLAPGEIGREVLRYAFALRLTNAEILRARYFDPEHRTDETHPVVASREAQRLCTRSLARYLLWLVGLVEGRLGLAAPAAVSAGEILDAQIHLVDRYVHVQLGVDERVPVRELLRGAVEAEVQHYLGGGYRDHLLHALDVFMLGDLLLGAEIEWLDGRMRRLAAHISEIRTRGTEPSHIFHAEHDVFRDWAVASLLHDVGYQLKWLRRLAADQGQVPPWHGYFKLPCPPRDRELVPDGKESADDFLKRLASKIRGVAPEADTWLPGPDEVALSRDHGVHSALRVAQLAAHFDALEPRAVGERSPTLAAISAPLAAIACHNVFEHSVRFDTEPLACLLRICDELQEWDRKRVDAEQILRGLYLSIIDQPGTSQDALRKSECVRAASANIEFGVVRGRFAARIAGRSLVTFTLQYEDPKQGHYDATRTLLSKAHNLQYVDLALDQHDGHHDLRICLELIFPRPAEYGSMTEYDFYGLLAEQVGALPLLRTFQTIDQQVDGGVFRLHTSDVAKEDRFGIVVCRHAAAQARQGWLSADPWPFLRELDAIKRRLLTGAL